MENYDPTLREFSLSQAITIEMDKANSKHGSLQKRTRPDRMCILTEEVGELAECVNVLMDNPSHAGAIVNLEYELIQIAATAIRWLEEHRKEYPTEKENY